MRCSLHVSSRNTARPTIANIYSTAFTLRALCVSQSKIRVSNSLLGTSRLSKSAAISSACAAIAVLTAAKFEIFDEIDGLVLQSPSKAHE